MTNWDIKKLVAAFSLGLVLSACQPEGADKVEVDSDDGNKASAVKAEDKTSYALGAKMASFIRTDLDKYDIAGINKEAIAKGFNDSLKAESKMSEQEIADQFVIFQQAMQAAHQQAQAVAQAKAAEDAAPIISAGDAFLAENAKKEGVVTTESGLQYRVITEGKGQAKPTANDSVKVHYHGTYIDGSVFDSSVEKNLPITFALNRVIKGWTEGLQLMTVGSKFHFVVPWQIAYGAQGRQGGIPGYSVLQFEVELLDINPGKAKPNAEVKVEEKK